MAGVDDVDDAIVLITSLQGVDEAVVRGIDLVDNLCKCGMTLWIILLLKCLQKSSGGCQLEIDFKWRLEIWGLQVGPRAWLISVAGFDGYGCWMEFVYLT